MPRRARRADTTRRPPGRDADGFGSPRHRDPKLRPPFTPSGRDPLKGAASLVHPPFGVLQAARAFEDEQSVLRAVHAGAHGYLLKDEPTVRIVGAVEEAATGAHPISSRVAGYLLTHARRAPPPVLLSDREEELAVALAEGLTYVECGERMKIALGTVQDYVKRVYRKLDINSKREVREWVEQHLNHR